MKITWFRHHHENRNDLLRFGFMRLHYGGELRYVEKPFSDAGRAGFSNAILNYPDPRHLSFILVENGRQKIRCLVDNEDSFALITPLISEVDVCFCAGYNSDFFEKKQFIKPYSWQDETDIGWYRDTIEKKITGLGSHFNKIKKFVPITTNMGYAVNRSVWKQKFNNMHHRLNLLTGRPDGFTDDYKGFEIRDGMLHDLRRHKLEYDVVLNDTLWGWPQHRMNLHFQLQHLFNKGYKIHSALNWATPSAIDGGSEKNLHSDRFPIVTGTINDKYEIMLAKSRLAVFACGFHWGWRSVMMLALSTGIPVVTDRLLTEAYFDMGEFHLIQTEDDSWATIEDELKNISDTTWESIKLQNQAVYDKYMAPEAVAGYFLNSLNPTPYPHEYNKSITSKWKNSS